MDVKRPLKTSRVKLLLFISVGIISIVICYFALNYNYGGYAVKASSVLIGQVKKGDMVVEIQGNGILAPRNVSWVSSSVGGIVKNVNVKQGTILKPGDTIAEMTNPELVEATESLRWELNAQEAEHQALLSKQENDLLNAQIEIVEAQQKYHYAKLEYDAAKILNKRNNGSVSMLVYRRSKLTTEQSRQSLAYKREQFEKLNRVKKEELEASNARISKLKNMLARSQAQVSSLTVKATEAGLVQVINIEAGQHITTGQSISRIVRKDQLIAEVKVPERQIRDVSLGQSVVIDTHISQIQGKISRIDPAVINGTVQVDVEFTEPLPDEARPDLSIEGRIQVSHLKNVLFAPRPIYAQSNTPTVVYKLSSDGKSAIKTPVTFGQGSANEIVIISGLAVNDQIILSSYQSWEHVDQINITR